MTAYEEQQPDMPACPQCGAEAAVEPGQVCIQCAARDAAWATEPHPPVTDSVSADWDDPAPLWGEARPPAFPIDTAFPPGLAVLREYLQAVAIATSVPLDMPVLCAMSIACTAVAKRAEIQLWEGYRENTALWALVLMDSASRKSAILPLLLAAVEAWEQAERDRLGPIIAQRQEELEIYTRRRDNARKAAASNKAGESQEHRAEAVELARMISGLEIPEVPELVTTDATASAVGQLLARNGERLLVASTESECIEHMLGKYSSTGMADFQIYLKGHAGDTIRTHRISRQGELLQKPALSMALLIQPDAVVGLFRSTAARNRGLLGRFLVAMPASLIGHRPVRAAPVPGVLQRAWDDAITALLELDGDCVTVELEHAAQELFMAFAADIESRLGAGQDLSCRRDWSGKLVGAIARIALVLHALEWALGKERGGIPGMLSVSTMQAATNWAQYLIDQEVLVSGVLEQDDTLRNAGRIARWVVAKGRTQFTIRQVQRGCRHSDLQKVAAIREAVSRLEEHGLVRRVQDQPGPNGGRQSEQYDVHPRFPEFIDHATH